MGLLAAILIVAAIFNVKALWASRRWLEAIVKEMEKPTEERTANPNPKLKGWPEIKDWETLLYLVVAAASIYVFAFHI